MRWLNLSLHPSLSGFTLPLIPALLASAASVSGSHSRLINAGLQQSEIFIGKTARLTLEVHGGGEEKFFVNLK